MNTDSCVVPVGPERFYLDSLATGYFQIQRCNECDRAVFYPRFACPYCGSVKLSWFAPAGMGTVYATTTVRRKDKDGGDYNICLIDLDEGVRMMSQVLGCLAQDVAIGMRVKARIDTSAGVVKVVFDHEGDGHAVA